MTSLLWWCVPCTGVCEHECLCGSSKDSLVHNRVHAFWTCSDTTTANPRANDSGCLSLKACYLPLNFKGGLKGAFLHFSVFVLIAADKSPPTGYRRHDYMTSALSESLLKKLHWCFHVKYLGLFVLLLWSLSQFHSSSLLLSSFPLLIYCVLLVSSHLPCFLILFFMLPVSFLLLFLTYPLISAPSLSCYSSPACVSFFNTSHKIWASPPATSSFFPPQYFIFSSLLLRLILSLWHLHHLPIKNQSTHFHELLKFQPDWQWPIESLNK